MKHIFMLFSLLAVAGCDQLMPLNSAAPSYIKQLTALKEGDGTLVYLILADSSGQMTTAEGSVSIKVVQTATSYSSRNGIEEKETVLANRAIVVKRSDFRRAKIGLGAFEHDAILLPIGRLSYSEMYAKPSETSGVVYANFDPDSGGPMTAKETIIF